MATISPREYERMMRRDSMGNSLADAMLGEARYPRDHSGYPPEFGSKIPLNPQPSTNPTTDEQLLLLEENDI